MKVKQRKDIGEGHGYHLEGEKWKVNDDDTIKFTGPVSEGLLVVQRESKLVWIQQMASLSITFLPTYIFPSFFSLTNSHSYLGSGGKVTSPKICKEFVSFKPRLHSWVECAYALGPKKCWEDGPIQITHSTE